MSDVLVPVVHSFIVLDSEGDRLLAKYYDGRTKAEQIAFETLINKKTKNVPAKLDAEAILLEHEVIVFRSTADCKFFVCGSNLENELILVAVLDAIFDTVHALLRGQADKRTMLENLELVLLTIDEVIDHGHIFELDSAAVCGRVLMKGSDSASAGLSSASGNSGNQSLAVGDLTISQALGLARNQLLRGFNNPGQRGDGY